MNTINLIRAWKDAEYRATLSAEELATLPQHPAGLVELPEEEMAAVAGGRSYFTGTCGRVCQILTPSTAAIFPPSCCLHRSLSVSVL
ncbi:MAG: mersacidin/lichenicidin family type 2 lantibiotic [Caldilineaceae bacterium]